MKQGTYATAFCPTKGILGDNQKQLKLLWETRKARWESINWMYNRKSLMQLIPNISSERTHTVGLWPFKSLPKTMESYCWPWDTVQGIGFNCPGAIVTSSGMEGTFRHWRCKSGHLLVRLPAASVRVRWRPAFLCLARFGGFDLRRVWGLVFARFPVHKADKSQAKPLSDWRPFTGLALLTSVI